MKKPKIKKITTMAAALMVAAATVIAGIGYTLTAKEISWSAEKPSNAPASSNYTKDIYDADTFSITANGVKSWSTSDMDIAAVVNGKVTMKAPGVVSIARATGTGIMSTNKYLIQNSNMPASYTITRNQSTLKKAGATDTIPITMKDGKNNVVKGMVQWSSDDETVATVSEKEGVITAVASKGVANITGKFTDMYGQKQEIHYAAVVGQITNNGLIGPDDNNDYYKPTGDKDVYEKVDQDGNSKVPPEFIYDPDSNMSDGSTPNGDEQKFTPITDDMKATIPSAENFDNTKEGWLTDDELKAYEDAVKNAEKDGIKQGTDDKYYKPIGNGVWQEVTFDPSTGAVKNVEPENFVGGTAKDPSPYIPLYEIIPPTDTTLSDPSANDFSKVYPGYLTDNGEGSEKDLWEQAKAAKEAGLLGPDANGNYYKPLKPDGIYEVVDVKGNGFEPPKYVYDPEKNPEDGKYQNAVKGDDNKFYIENPKNVFTPVADDGTLNESGKVWGGDDAKPGTKDDKPAIAIGNQVFASMGENVYAPISSFNGKLGTLVGGGKDEDPTTNPAMPIYDNTAEDGHYYYGPFTDDDGIPYYVGDRRDGKGDGLINTENVASIDPSDNKYYRQENGSMGTDKPVMNIPAESITLGKPDSNTLAPDMTQKAPSVTVKPDNATNQLIEWSSDNTDVITVDPKTGEITAIANGTATITATITNPDGSKVTDQYTVEVNKYGSYETSNDDWVIVTTTKIDGKNYAFLTTKYLQGSAIFGNAGGRYADSGVRTAMDQWSATHITNKKLESSEWVGTGSGKIVGVPVPSNYLETSLRCDDPAGISVPKPDGGDEGAFAMSYTEMRRYFGGKDWDYADSRYARAGFMNNQKPANFYTSIYACYRNTEARAQDTPGDVTPYTYWLRSQARATNYPTAVFAFSGLDWEWEIGMTNGYIGLRPAIWVEIIE